MNLRPLAAAASILLASHLAQATPAGTTSPYAGEEARQIKALSPERIEGLLAGKGLGYGKPAELNGYPGPLHVLQLADQLELTEAQRAATQDLHTRMQAKAQAVGAQLLTAEAELEALFRGGAADDAGVLQKQLDRIGALEAQLRGSHLSAHIEQRAILSAQQNARYTQLRGYHSGNHAPAGHAH